MTKLKFHMTYLFHEVLFFGFLSIIYRCKNCCWIGDYIRMGSRLDVHIKSLFVNLCSRCGRV